jgi:heme exporter protein C
MRWTTFAATPRFYALTGYLIPGFWAVAALLGLAGLGLGLGLAPSDFQQGNVYRIIFIHVPAAWMSMVIYVAMAFWATVGWAAKVRVASMLARALAPTGTLFTVITLWTGSLWGKPTWGTWWVWDAKLTSYFVLLLLYIGYLALTSTIEERRRSDGAGAIVALVGVVNIPIIYFAAVWWNSLHQGPSVPLNAAPKIATSMLTAMLLMTFSFWSYAFAVVFTRTRALVLEEESHTEWVQSLRARRPSMNRH